MILDWLRRSGVPFVSPADGLLKDITQVEDEVFASKVMGEGFAVTPSSDFVVAPVAGTVAMIFPTGHALGLRSDDGTEVLVHVGIDSVALNGEGFTVAVSEGQHVKAGDVLLKFDLPLLSQRLPSTDIIVILTGGHGCSVGHPGRIVQAAEKNVARVRRK